MRTLAFRGLAVLMLGGQALAQAPAPDAPGGVAQVEADPERVAAAREVIAAAQGDRAAVLAAMKAPMVGMIQQMGIKEPEKARVMVEEVVMPTLAQHYDALLSIQALAFATALSKEDLKAVAAFYATPAGRSLVKAQPQLTQAMLTGTQHWMRSIAPELQDKIAKAAEAHGWSGTVKRH